MQISACTYIQKHTHHSLHNPASQESFNEGSTRAEKVQQDAAEKDQRDRRIYERQTAQEGSQGRVQMMLRWTEVGGAGEQKAQAGKQKSVVRN